LGTGGLMRHPRYHPNFPANDAVAGTPYMAGTLGRDRAITRLRPASGYGGGSRRRLLSDVLPFAPPLRGPFLSGVLPRSHRARGSLVRTGREYSPPSSGFGTHHYNTWSQGIGRRIDGTGGQRPGEGVSRPIPQGRPSGQGFGWAHE